MGAVTGANSEKSSKRRRITPLSLQVSIQLHFCMHTIFVPPFEKMKIRKLHEAFGEDCRLKTDEPCRSYVLVIFVFQNISRISSAHNCTVVDKIVAEIGPDFENSDIRGLFV